MTSADEEPELAQSTLFDLTSDEVRSINRRRRRPRLSDVEWELLCWIWGARSSWASGWIASLDLEAARHESPPLCIVDAADCDHADVERSLIEGLLAALHKKGALARRSLDRDEFEYRLVELQQRDESQAPAAQGRSA